MLLNNYGMNLQAEKLQLIEWLAGLEDINIVQRLLEVQRNSAAEVAEDEMQPLTAEELVARAKESNRAIEEGNYVDIEEALLELERRGK